MNNLKNKSILQKLSLGNVSLKQVSAKTLKPAKKDTRELISKWEYKILENNEKRLCLLANVNTKLEGMFELKASFLIEFKVFELLEINEVEENITDILYYAGANYTLLSSFLSNYILGFPVPISPNIEKSNLKVIESSK